MIRIRHAFARSPLLTLALCAALTSCDDAEQVTEPPATDGAAEVRAASVAWDDAFNTSDVTGLMALYADDAVSMPYYGPALEGKASIEADFRAFFADFDASHETTIVGLQIADDWAIERGEYTLEAVAKDGSGSFQEVGKHIVIRRKTASGWRVVWEIWNLDEPSP